MTRTAAVAFVLAASLPGVTSAQGRVTFSRDVAPILYEQCASCHRPGQIGPFSLLTYQDVRPRAAAIARATRTRQMPPWKPEPGRGGPFTGERRLNDEQIARIQQWVRDGTLEGDPGDLPPAPTFAEGWRLGRPDLVVTLADAYVLAAGEGDLLRNFVIPLPIASTVYVRGVEFRPGNASAVHHANMRIDRTPASRAFDAADGAPGFDGRLTTGNFPDGYFLGWTPGQLPPLAPADLAWRLDPGSDLVVQLHLQRGATAQHVQPAVGFFFSDRPPARTPVMLRLGRQNIDIPAGRGEYVVEDRYVLPVDVAVHAVQPHAHFRARRIEGFATRPDGTTTPLITIADWDFTWQDAYRYIDPVRLPRGTAIGMRYTYDNSAANRRNPDRPPRRVRWGQNSTDEMGDLWLQVLPLTADDRAALLADFGPKVLAEDAAGYETLLKSEPANARLHEAAAIIYLTLGRVDAAVARLTDAIRLAPDAPSAHYNLGTAYAWQRRFEAAAGEFRRALQLQPDHVAAHVNLAVALRSLDRAGEAERHLERALQIDPHNAAAHTNLAAIRRASGRTREAVAHYRSALVANPDLLEALADLSWLLGTSSDGEIRDPVEAVRLAGHAAALTGERDIRVLDSLAAARAAAADFDGAIAAIERALDVAAQPRADDTIRVLESRRALYRAKTALYDPR
jgi:tetratricopeptide (TPR) repeat protein/mono/diheme cytochrome c family protein